ncbi:MAG: hypothetical protein ACLUIQ_02695 [Dialister invisus]
MSTCTVRFSVSHFINRLPETVKKIAVLDRTREPGAIGEPLFLDVQSAVTAAEEISRFAAAVTD